MARCMSLSGRWKVDAEGAKMHHPVSKQPILQFVSIKRKDCGEWAIPGVCGYYMLYISFSNFLLLLSVIFHSVTATLLHSALLFTLPTQPQQCVRCSCDLLVCVSVFAGDGRSRGAGLSHTAAGVLGRGVKLVGSAAVRESKYP